MKYFQRALKKPYFLQIVPCVYQKKHPNRLKYVSLYMVKTFYATKVTYFIDQMNPLTLIF